MNRTVNDMLIKALDWTSSFTEDILERAGIVSDLPVLQVSTYGNI